MDAKDAVAKKEAKDEPVAEKKTSGEKIKLAEHCGGADKEAEEIEETTETGDEDATKDLEEEVVAPAVTKEDEEEGELASWVPKTKLGEMVKAGEMTLDEVFSSRHQIREPEIIDFLLPDVEEKMMLIGGSPGKGGGIQRRPSRRTVRVHKSGRRTNASMMTIIGDARGYIGIGVGKANTNKAAREKSLKNAKLNIFPVRKGCGSWECNCGEGHSIPFAITGKCGSVEVKLMPAPKGLGLCVSDEMKKMFQILGIKDVRLKSRGQTGTRINFIYAIEDALKNLNRMKF